MSPTEEQDYIPLGHRFRGFCPVVVDVETGGFNASTDALLEVAAVLIGMNKDKQFFCQQTVAAHVRPFDGANLDPASLEVNGIDPFHPLRIALPEKEALQKIFTPVHKQVRQNQCTGRFWSGTMPFSIWVSSRLRSNVPASKTIRSIPSATLTRSHWVQWPMARLSYQESQWLPISSGRPAVPILPSMMPKRPPPYFVT